MFKTIVTGVDGKQGGRDALRLAAELARVGSGEIIAVWAFPYFHRPTLAAAPAVKVQRDETQAMLDRELAELGIAARTHVPADASPARALHLVAEREGADLIVVGSTRRGVMGRVLVGDDALGTLHGSRVPVAVAPREFSGGDGVRRIGVGFDGTEESRQALALAAALARVLDAELDLLSVIDSPAAMAAETGYSMDWLNEVQAHREERLRRVIDEIDVPAHGEAVIGTPVEDLTELSKRVDLLVVGSRGWGPVRRVLVGSTAAGLMRHSACPLIVLPRGAATGQPGEDQPAVAGADSPSAPDTARKERPVNTIVVGYDETGSSDRALERASRLAQGLSAKLVVTSVAPMMHGAGRGAGAIDPIDSPSRHVEELRHARAYLEERGIEADYVPALGDPARAIVMIADERDADLIIVGTHEPGIIARLLEQSVSESVSHHSHRDVLIVHPG